MTTLISEAFAIFTTEYWTQRKNDKLHAKVRNLEMKRENISLNRRAKDLEAELKQPEQIPAYPPTDPSFLALRCAKCNQTAQLSASKIARWMKDHVGHPVYNNSGA